MKETKVYEFSQNDLDALNATMRLCLNIGEKNVAEKIKWNIEHGHTKLTLVEKSKGKKVNICINRAKVEKILTSWHFFFIGGDSFRFTTEEKRRQPLEIFAKSLKDIRLSTGISQRQLAKTLKVSNNYISQVEGARRFLSLLQIERIADALGAEVSIVLRRKKKN
jgi:DNA-binding XRE family transcriptional regulator